MNGTVMGGAVPGFPDLKQVFSNLAEYLCDLVYHSRAKGLFHLSSSPLIPL